MIKQHTTMRQTVRDDIPSAMEHFGILNVQDSVQVEEYERGFFSAHAALARKAGLRTVWEWDDARQRLRVGIPYEDQVVYTRRDRDGHLLSAMVVSVSRKDFQCRFFGFAPDVQSSRYCEILSLFSTPRDVRGGSADRGALLRMRDFGFRYLATRGYEVGYTSCAPLLQPLYQQLGAELLAHTVVGGAERCLLRWFLTSQAADAADYALQTMRAGGARR